jgi:DNA-binding NarL/FixJ family response regulator
MRNAHLRAEAEQALGITRSPRDSAIAALLLEAKSDKQISAATGMQRGEIHKRLINMRKRCAAPNRVGLALALRELV